MVAGHGEGLAGRGGVGGVGGEGFCEEGKC